MEFIGQKQFRTGFIVFDTRSIWANCCDDLKLYKKCENIYDENREILFKNKYVPISDENLLVDVKSPTKITIGRMLPIILNVGKYILPGKLFKYHNIEFQPNSDIIVYTGYKIDPVLHELCEKYNILLSGLKTEYSSVTGFDEDEGYYVYYALQGCHMCGSIYIKDRNICNINTLFKGYMTNINEPKPSTLYDTIGVINHNSLVDKTNAQIATLCDEGKASFLDINMSLTKAEMQKLRS